MRISQNASKSKLDLISNIILTALIYFYNNLFLLFLRQNDVVEPIRFHATNLFRPRKQTVLKYLADINKNSFIGKYAT